MLSKKSIVKFLIVFLVAQFLINSFSLTFTAAVGKGEYVVESSDDILPYPYSRGSAVWVEDSIYIFGGRNETDMLDRIMKYIPSTNELAILDTKLSIVLMGSTAVYNGKYVYIFGGKDYDKFYDSILRFDPKTESIVNMSARLPNPTVGAAAVWDGNFIYFFGGSWGGILPRKFDTILRYDTERDNITIMNSSLPYGRSGLAATVHEKDIYVIGGSDGRNYSAEIFKYLQDDDKLIFLPAELPSGRKHIQAEFHNGSIYIFGGRGAPTVVYDQIVKFDIKTNEVEILEDKLPRPSEFRMHAYDGESIYIIGGFSGQKDINQFTIFHPELVETSNPKSYCSPEDRDSQVWVILLILAFVIIITLLMNYRKKK